MSTHLAILAASLAADAPSGATAWLPPPSSTIAPGVDMVFNGINAVCYFFFALIMVLMVYFVVKYRVRKGQAFRSDAPLHHLPLETTWAVVPLLIVVVMFYVGFRDYLNMSTPPKNAYVVKVTAVKWGWSFQYPTGATSDDLYVPAGRPVQLTMRSSDVLHSCYIPDFRVKKDLVPGRYSYLWFQADQPTPSGWGHNLFCTEYCGTGHSNMNRKVHVLPEAEFDAWLVEQGQWLDKIPDEELYFRAGPKIFARCQQCHSLDGTKGIGPSWKGIWARLNGGEGSGEKFADGTTYAGIIGPGKKYATPEDYLRNSILNPGSELVGGYGNAMPSFKGQLNDRAIDAVIGMMQHLDDFDPKTGASLKEAPPAAPLSMK
jgi:cytochrome c oxidase subunit 2